MAGDPSWRCLGCGVQLDLEYTDAWCHTCLDHLRQKLADRLGRRYEG
jgi:hypothetical protein